MKRNLEHPLLFALGSASRAEIGILIGEDLGLVGWLSIRFGVGLSVLLGILLRINSGNWGGWGKWNNWSNWRNSTDCAWADWLGGLLTTWMKVEGLVS